MQEQSHSLRYRLRMEHLFGTGWDDLDFSSEKQGDYRRETRSPIKSATGKKIKEESSQGNTTKSKDKHRRKLLSMDYSASSDYQDRGSGSKDERGQGDERRGKTFEKMTDKKRRNEMLSEDSVYFVHKKSGNGGTSEMSKVCKKVDGDTKQHRRSEKDSNNHRREERLVGVTVSNQPARGSCRKDSSSSSRRRKDLGQGTERQSQDNCARGHESNLSSLKISRNPHVLEEGARKRKRPEEDTKKHERSDQSTNESHPTFAAALTSFDNLHMHKIDKNKKRSKVGRKEGVSSKSEDSKGENTENNILSQEAKRTRQQSLGRSSTINVDHGVYLEPLLAQDDLLVNHPLSTITPVSENIALTAILSSRRKTRTRVYSGELQSIASRPALRDTDNSVLPSKRKAALEKASAQDFFQMGSSDPSILQDTDMLWKNHCHREFPKRYPVDMKSWRDLYARCSQDRDQKLKTLTDRINRTMVINSVSKPTTKLVLLDKCAEPSKKRRARTEGIRPTQTASRPKSDESNDVSAGKIAQHRTKKENQPYPAPLSTREKSSVAKKTQVAPLMSKSRTLYKLLYHHL